MSQPFQRRNSSLCPPGLAAYAHLHLDSMTKVISHVVGLALICEVLLMFSTFSVSFLDHRLGFSPSFCFFLLAFVSFTIIFTLNNRSMSIVPTLSPTEYMIGVATGLSIGAACFAWLISATYASGVVCGDKTMSSHPNRFLILPMIPSEVAPEEGILSNETATTMPTTISTTIPPSHAPMMVDPVMTEACENHQTTTYAIWFWAGLAAWLHVLAAIMLFVGRLELATNSPVYESVHYNPSTTGTAPSPPVDFEEAYRRQQQQILGTHQAAAIQNRAASMFVGDYSTIPEVTQGESRSLTGV